MKKLKNVLVFSIVVFIFSFSYFLYVSSEGDANPHEETYLDEIGEGFGGLGLAALALIYGRTVLKLSLGKGGFAQRIIPMEYTDVSLPFLKKMLRLLNKTHLYVGIIAVAAICLHVSFMGLMDQNLLLLFVFLLVFWQALFGFFLSWRYSSKELRKVSYLVHAQFISGIMIGIFTFFGHLLAED